MVSSSLLSVCIKSSSEVRRESKGAIDAQQNTKLGKIKIIKEKKIKATSKKYINMLHYHDEFFHDSS